MTRRPNLHKDTRIRWERFERPNTEPQPRIIKASFKQSPTASAVSFTKQSILIALKIFLTIFIIGVVATIGIGYIFPSDGPFGINHLSGIADAINIGPLGRITDMLPYIGPLKSVQYGEDKDNYGENSFDANYNCELTTTSSLGTVKASGIFTCYQNRCSILSERGFNGVVDSSGTFTGTNVVRTDPKGNPVDTIPINGVFSSTSKFTLRGSGNGFTQIFVCEKV